MFGSLAGLFGGNSPDDDNENQDAPPPRRHEQNAGATRPSTPLQEALFSGDSPIKYGSGHLKYCLVEARQSETGKHLATYATCAEGYKATDIPKDLIYQACLSGGDMVRGVFFRFVDEKGQALSKQVLKSIQHPLPSKEAVDNPGSREETSARRMSETTGTNVTTCKPLPETTLKATREKPSRSPTSLVVASSVEKAANEPDENVESDENLESDPSEKKKEASTKVTMMAVDTISDKQEDEEVNVDGKKRAAEEDITLNAERTDNGNTINAEETVEADATDITQDEPKSLETHKDVNVGGVKKRPREEDISVDAERAVRVDGINIENRVPTQTTVAVQANESPDITLDRTRSLETHKDVNVGDDKKRARKEDASLDAERTIDHCFGVEKRLPAPTTVAAEANESSDISQEEPKSLETRDKKETTPMEANKPPNVRQNDGKAQAILSRRIRAMDISTGYEETFASIEEAVVATQTHKSLIELACLGGGGTTGGKLYFGFADMQRGRPASLAATPEEGGPIPPSTFDVSTLLPVRKSQQAPVKPLRVIELLDKGTKKVVCCFRGITKAHRALGIDRNFVLRACTSYGSSVQPDLGTYILRYADDQNAPLLGYEYGAHKEDYKVIKETHQARLARWTRVMSKVSDSSGLPPTKKIKRSYRKRKDSTVASQNVITKVSDSAKQNSKSTPITIGEAAAAKEINLNEISVPSKITNNTDTSMMCIMCQTEVANVVFEPCHHCVLCSRCSETICRNFCPTCRTMISDRIKPKSIRVIRPRVYSSYSFM